MAVFQNVKSRNNTFIESKLGYTWRMISTLCTLNYHPSLSFSAELTKPFGKTFTELEQCRSLRIEIGERLKAQSTTEPPPVDICSTEMLSLEFWNAMRNNPKPFIFDYLLTWRTCALLQRLIYLWRAGKPAVQPLSGKRDHTKASSQTDGVKESCRLGIH